MNFTSFCKPWLIALLLSASPAIPVSAANLILGRSSPQSVLDPHYTVLNTGVAVAPDIYDRLVRFGLDLQLEPGLALSWKPINPTMWEIKLRPGVKFHDGSSFGAKDVIYSFKRTMNIPNSPSPVSIYMSAVDRVEAVDDLTLHITTKGPAPLLMDQIGMIFIVPETLGNATTADFNSGKAAIGTGPYKFVEWVPNEEIKVTANREWWGGKPEFDNVTTRFIVDPAARVAALLSGQVDVIDAVPPADLKLLEKNAKINVFSEPSVRLLFLHLDVGNDVSPFITDLDGKPLSKNPLKDLRVRKALSLLIDRKALTERIQGGNAAPAGQVAAKGQGGYDPALAPDSYDRERAKALLADAGYPNGFGVTLHCASDRDANSPQTLQAIAQTFSRGGIKVKSVDCKPYSVFSGEADKQKYSIFLWGRNDAAPDTSLNLRNGYMTFNAEAGFGAFNRGRWSNAEFDKLVSAALQEFDKEKRYDLLRKATGVMVSDTAVVPLYFMNGSWAARKGFRFDANMALFTGIEYVHKVN